MNKITINLLLCATIFLSACGNNTKNLSGKYIFKSEYFQIDSNGTGVYVTPPIEEKISWSKEGENLVVKMGEFNLKLKIGKDSLTMESSGTKYTKATK